MARMTGITRKLPALLLALTLALASRNAVAQDLTFTYQGEVREAGFPVEGAADLRFVVFSDAQGQTQLGTPVQINATQLRSGRFTVPLNFGVAPPAGAAIEIQVRSPADPSDTQPFVTLAPRQTITAAPVALSATLLNGQPASFFQSASNLTSGVLPSAQLSGLYLSTVNLENTGNTFRGSFAGTGAQLTNLNASNLTSGTLPPNRLTGTFTQIVTFNNPGNTFIGSGAGLVGLNASNIASGILSPARGGTGTQITAANQGDVLKWSGAAFVPQPDANTTYTAGAGLSLSGTVFSVGTSAITPAMLASDSIGLSRVTGGRFVIAPDGRMSSDNPISVTNVIQASEFQYQSPSTSYVMVGPSEFVGRNGAPVSQIEIGGITGAFVNAPSTEGMVAPVQLPHGATIRSVRCFVVDSAFLNELSITLRRTAASTGVSIVVGSAVSSGFVPTVATLDIGGLAVVVDNQNEIYEIRANNIGGGNWPGSDLRVVGVRIEYTMPRPAR